MEDIVFALALKGKRFTVTGLTLVVYGIVMTVVWTVIALNILSRVINSRMETGYPVVLPQVAGDQMHADVNKVILYNILNIRYVKGNDQDTI